jgi:hypothetical protein
VPYLETHSLDRTIVAPSIYGSEPHAVTDTTLIIEQALREELQDFLGSYTRFLGVEHEPKWFRVDLYFDAVQVHIIEVNVEVADGWGVALNLMRAADNPLVGSFSFPSEFLSFAGDLRQTEFLLALSEWKRIGHRAGIRELETRVVDPLDNKRHLARFSKAWRGERVRVPRLYDVGCTPWEDVPTDVYLKFADKFSPEAAQSRYSVKPRSELGRARQMRELYGQGLAIAQDRAVPHRLSDNRQVQAVVMCAGSRTVAGYIQVAPSGRQVINDKGTEKGALFFL